MPMRKFARVAVAVLALSVAPPARAADAAPPPGPRDVALATKIVGAFVLPRYRAFATAAAAEAVAWETGCRAARGADAAPLEAAFQTTADAWAAVEVLRYGPVAEASRYERIVHWPERRNAIAKGLAALFAAGDEADLAPVRFRQQSVAVQGLSALERLLYDPAEAGRPAARRCAVGRAIAAGLAATAAEIVAGWADGPDATVERLKDPEAAREALTRIATDTLALYKLIIDSKIGIAMGKTLGEARPALAEMARSGRSARIVAIDLEAIDALTRLIVDPDAEGGGMTLDTIASARSIAETMPGDIGPLAAGKATRSRVVLLASAVESAREMAVATIPAALGVAIGFNSLDGD